MSSTYGDLTTAHTNGYTSDLATDVSTEALFGSLEGLVEPAEGLEPGGVLESPFGAGLATEPAAEVGELFDELVGELEDEDFTDAVVQLVDAAAGAQLAAESGWSVPAAGPGLAAAELQGWIEPLAEQAERTVEALASAAEGVDLQRGTAAEVEAELDAALEAAQAAVAPAAEGGPVFEDFLRGLARKAGRFAKRAVALARKGVAAVSKVLPPGILLRKLVQLVRPMLRRVVSTALRRLPPAVQPIGRKLAASLGVPISEAEAQEAADAGEALAEDLDARLAALLLAPDEAEADGLVGEAEADAETDTEELDGDAAAALDAARERLARALPALPPGTPPTAELEEFLPAVMAVLPAVRMAIGRDRIARFLTDRITGLVSAKVGADAARQIARPIVDVGMRMIGMEVPPGTEAEVAGEALASTVEETVRRVLELPAEALADPLALDAAVQQGFAEAAAAYLPDRLLHSDLPERETDGEGGVWVLMPRSARPRYRFRKHLPVVTVQVARRLARAVPWSDGGTLETHLADRGVRRWPVDLEVHLYETPPGSRLGHLEHDETAAAGTSEAQPLTPEIAGLLLREPGLGRRHRYAGRPAAAPGRRFFRVRPVGAPRGGRRTGPRRRVVVRLDLLGATPRLRVALRLSEREGQQIATALTRTGRPDLPGVLARLQRRCAVALPAALVAALLRRKLVPDAGAAGATAGRVAAAVAAGLSTFLQQRAQQLVDAVRAPAQGVTITVTFSGIRRDDLAGSLPQPQVAVRPGWRSGG